MFATVSQEASKQIATWAEKVGFDYDGYIVYPYGRVYRMPDMPPLLVDLSATHPDCFMAVTLNTIKDYHEMVGRNEMRSMIDNCLKKERW